MNDAIAERAQALARWLSTPAGGPIPDSLEPEVVEAIIALRPERAPPHTITIEAVLAAKVIQRPAQQACGFIEI